VLGKILAARDYLAVAPKVVAVATDVPLPAYDDALPSTPADPAALAALSERWNLGTPVARLTAVLAR